MGGQGPLQVPFKYWLAASLTRTQTWSNFARLPLNQMGNEEKRGSILRE